MSHVENQSTAVETRSQAKIFADQYEAETGNSMIRAINKIRKRAAIITIIVLCASMPHQINYLLGLASTYMLTSNWHQWLETIGITLVCLAVPVSSDLLIVNCIETIGAKAASKWSKIRAFMVILFPISGSAYVNAAAPGPMLIKCLAAFLVTMIPMAEVLKLITPDFRKVGEMSASVREQVAVEPVTVRRPRARNNRERVLRILEDNPEMKAVEVAKKAGVSANYVYTIRRQSATVDA